MVQKVIDPAKIVTDGVVLRELARQGIDKDYVEFWKDYGARHQGLSPYAKFYRDLKSGRQFMVVSGLPMVKPDGSKVEVGWLPVEGKYYSKANLFSAIVEGTQVKLTCLSDQPYGAKKDEQVIYNPQLFVDGQEVTPASPTATLLGVDPQNENYSQNVLEWDYGICKRRIRIIEGRFRERWLFYANPNGDVRIKHNFTGNLPIRLGYGIDADGNSIEVEVAGDEERVSASAFAQAVYPVEIGAEQTFYPDPDPESASVDGRVAHYDGAGLTWTDLVGAVGTNSNDSNSTDYCTTVMAYGNTDEWSVIGRGIYLYDSSGLPDNANISAATLSLRGFSKTDPLSITPDVNIYSSAPASNTALAGGDYDSLGSTAFSTAISYANFDGAGGWNDFALNASGIANISKTGVSKFGARNANYDVAEELDPGNHAPTWSAGELQTRLDCYFAEQGAGYKPKLVVTYTVVTEKTSSETGSGVESLGSRLFGAAEVGSGTGVSSLLAVLTGTGETGLGSEFAAKVFSAFDSGSGIDAVIARLLGATETGLSVEAALLIAALISGDGGVGSDLSALLKALLASDGGSGSEALKALIATMGSDMRLDGRPGQVRIPSKGVNL